MAPAKDAGVVRVEVLGQDVVADLGVEALAFRLNRAAEVDGLLPVGVTVDYSAFAELYGADWATRLKLVAVPECALTTPELAECQQRTVVPTRNDLVAGALVIDGVAVGDPVPGTRPKLLDGTVLDQDVESLKDEAAARSRLGESEVPVDEFGESTGALAAPPVVGTGGVVFALTAGTGGESGNFSATPLGIDQAWTVGDSSGGFTYSYEIPVQPPFAGTAPEVGLLYSSQSIDGMNFATNSQASPVGLGWDVPQAYIERSFKSCRDDGGAVDDLCWFTDGTGTFDHMSISLNGVSDQIVWTGGSFQITGDPVWRVEQRYGAPHQKGTSFSNPAEHGEFWVVTMKDGTEYWFGYDLGDQHSAWTVPVIGNHPSEPCYQAGDCDQVYKFMLDRVVDTNGNTILYNYDTEINKYAYKTLVYSPRDYVSGGTLSKIVYGINDTDLSDNSAPTNGLAEVVFNAQYRCGTLDSSCPVPTSSSSAQFPDVPVDLICQGATCSKTSPSFFSVKRLASVDSRVWNGGWVTTDRVTLAHTFPYANPVEAGVSPRLFLQGVQRTVYPDGPGTFNLPSNFFAPTSASWLASRTYPNPGGGIPATMLPRTADFRDEHGSITYVEYGQQNPCPTNPQKTGGWDTNTFDCYPMWTGGTSPGFVAYNKYLTKKVTAHDATVAVSSDLETTYDYVGAPAWHYDDSVAVSTANKTWSNWRGYEIVRSHTGPAGGPQTHDESRYFRGMHGDRLVGGGTKSVSVGLSDGSATFTDHGWLAGMPVEEITLDSTGSSWMERTRHEYTWSNQGNTDPLWPRWVEESAVTNQLTSGSGPVTSRTRFEYEPTTAEVVRVHDDGDLATAADDRCTVTANWVNGAEHILDRPASTALWGRASGGGSVCATGEGQQVGLSQFFYDGGFIGSKGNLTTTISYQSSGHPVTTTASYDGYGRATSATNGRGKSTSTGYSPASGWPSQVTVTNPVGHVTRTDYQVERFLPYRVTDPNGNVTFASYDRQGRVAQVWAPSEAGMNQTPGGSASYAYFYGVDSSPWFATSGRGANGVCTLTLLDAAPATAVYQPSCVYYDAFGRERQTQAAAVSSTTPNGRLVGSSTYDARGFLTVRSDEPYHDNTATPVGAYHTGAAAPGSATFTTYDALERPTAETFLAPGISWTTSTSHDGLVTTVTPPGPLDAAQHPTGLPTRTTRDVDGKPVAVDEFTDLFAVARTTYSYTARGELATITDADGNVTTSTFDWMGNRLSLNDPDQGLSTYAYDDNNNLTLRTDAAGTQVSMIYDDLDRLTDKHSGGVPLAKWVFDKHDVPNEPDEYGLLNYSSSFDVADGSTWEYRTDITGYDSANRPTGRSYGIPGRLPRFEVCCGGARSWRREWVAGVVVWALGVCPGCGWYWAGAVAQVEGVMSSWVASSTVGRGSVSGRVVGVAL